MSAVTERIKAEQNIFERMCGGLAGQGLLLVLLSQRCSCGELGGSCGRLPALCTWTQACFGFQGGDAPLLVQLRADAAVHARLQYSE